jgi:pilus assembly protein TadC
VIRTTSASTGRAAVAPEQVADTLVLVVLALRSGLAVADALRRVADVSVGAVAADLRAVVAALEWGVAPGEAWSYAGAEWRPAAVAFRMSARTGASPTSLLADAVTRCRVDLQEQRSRRAARAGVLLVLPLGLGFLPAFAFTAVVPVVLALASGVLSGR